MRLGLKLKAMGYNTTANAVFGMGALTAAQYATVYDPRVSFGSGWDASANQSLGGPMFVNSTTANPLSISFTDPFNQIVVYTHSQSGGGSCIIDTGGATLATINTSGTDAMTTTTVAAGSVGTPTINIKPASAGALCEVIAVEAYDSTKPGQIIMENVGRGGWQSGNWNFFGLTWRPGQAVRTIAPQLIINALGGVNDVNSAVPVATYTANMQSMMTQWLQASDMILVTLVPSDTSFSSVAAQQTYEAAAIALGSANGVPVYDLFKRIGTRADGNANGLYGDARHGNELLHDDEATALQRFIIGKLNFPPWWQNGRINPAYRAREVVAG